MTRFGWCFSAEGATTNHDSCPVEIGMDNGIVRCGCFCHEEVRPDAP